MRAQVPCTTGTDNTPSETKNETLFMPNFKNNRIQFNKYYRIKGICVLITQTPFCQQIQPPIHKYPKMFRVFARGLPQ